jgi:putative NADH-flavin reductase
MRVTIFGATGSLGRQCLEQCLEAEHEVSVLARTPSKLPTELASRVQVIEGDALDSEAVSAALEGAPEAVFFAIGVDKHSPEDLCTDITRHILAAMSRHGVGRLIWCGGGSTRLPADVVTFGSRFVELFASTFLGLRHRDKAHQIELLERHRGVSWLGVRPLQMRLGPKTCEYRLGYDRYSGMSRISFADCAHAMLGMLDDDTWLHQAPIVQY